MEADALNSTALRVAWKPPLQGKQHGQIRGYQVVFSRLENGEPRGQPNLLDVSLPEAQVRACLSQFTPPHPFPHHPVNFLSECVQPCLREAPLRRNTRLVAGNNQGICMIGSWLTL